MKRLVCALVLTIAGFGQVFAADPLIPIKDFVLTGSFTTAPANPKKGFVSIPITKAVLLENFGSGDVKASETGYFIGQGGTIVLANKNDETVYVSLFTMASNGGAPVGVGANNNLKTRVLQDVTVFNDTFSGTTVTTSFVVYKKPTRGTLSQKGQFQAAGPFPAGANTNAVVSGTFSFSLTGPLEPLP